MSRDNESNITIDAKVAAKKSRAMLKMLQDSKFTPELAVLNALDKEVKSATLCRKYTGSLDQANISLNNATHNLAEITKAAIAALEHCIQGEVIDFDMQAIELARDVYAKYGITVDTAWEKAMNKLNEMPEGGKKELQKQDVNERAASMQYISSLNAQLDALLEYLGVTSSEVSSPPSTPSSIATPSHASTDDADVYVKCMIAMGVNNEIAEGVRIAPSLEAFSKKMRQGRELLLGKNNESDEETDIVSEFYKNGRISPEQKAQLEKRRDKYNALGVKIQRRYSKEYTDPDSSVMQQIDYTAAVTAHIDAVLHHIEKTEAKNLFNTLLAMLGNEDALDTLKYSFHKEARNLAAKIKEYGAAFNQQLLHDKLKAVYLPAEEKHAQSVSLEDLKTQVMIMAEHMHAHVLNDSKSPINFIRVQSQLDRMRAGYKEVARILEGGEKKANAPENSEPSQYRRFDSPSKQLRSTRSKSIAFAHEIVSQLTEIMHYIEKQEQIAKQEARFAGM